VLASASRRRVDGARRREVETLRSSTPDALWHAEALQRTHPLAVACRDLRRSVDGQLLLDGVTLSVPVGARLLVVGRPAASASLLLRILAGLARFDGGSVRVAGMADPSRAGWAERVAYVGAPPSFFRWMRVRDVLGTVASLAGLPRDEARRRMTAAAATVELTDGLDARLDGSDAVRAERAALAAALVGEPEVLLLDEPLAALPATDRVRILERVTRSATTLLTSRTLIAEARLFGHVALLRRGRVTITAPVAEVAANGLPLTIRGIEQLAAVLRRRERAAPARVSHSA
jgi:ABC-type multidrug transport system ATPase subunit